MISVIIPTLNEAFIIGETLARMASEPGIEIIVADGGSSDATVAIARGCGVTVINTARGRAAQMNAGAKSARGGVLLFLHADTRLPVGFSRAVIDTMADENTAGGAFSFRLDDDSLAARIVELGANFRSRWLRLPYGDQAIFARRETFFAAGGFPVWPVMEDSGLIRELRRRGKVRILREAAVTSARRFRRAGYMKTIAIHLTAATAFAVGISPAAINRWLVRRGYRAAK